MTVLAVLLIVIAALAVWSTLRVVASVGAPPKTATRITGIYAVVHLLITVGLVAVYLLSAKALLS